MGNRALVFPVKQLPLHCMLSSMGCEERADASYDYSGLERGREPFAIWQYTLSGQGRLMYEGETMLVTPGTAMCLQVPQNHRYSVLKDGTPWTFMFLTLYGTELMRLWRDIAQVAGPLIKHNAEGDCVACARTIVQRGLKHRLASPFEASRLAYEFVMRLAEEVLPNSPERRVPDFLRRAVRFALDHLSEPIGVEDLAGAAGMSRYHFTRVFTERQGLPPGRFITHLRLREAVRLLQTERCSVKEIAVRCGFNDTSYFCKVFRRQYRCSPAAFQRTEGTSYS